MTSHAALPTAELAIYAVLAVPVLVVLFRHLPLGAAGWGYLFAFCTLRIVGGALSRSGKQPAAANIISNVGLSPLLLAASGILHEARHLRAAAANKSLELTLFVFYHAAVLAGVALVAAGGSSLSSDHPKPNASKLVKAGIAILTVCWVALCAWVVSSVRPPRHVRAAATAAREGTVLLYSLAASLVLVGIRVLYSLVALCSEKPSLNPATGSLAIRVVLAFLPELIAVLILLGAGILTLNAMRLRAAAVPAETEGSGKQAEETTTRV
ncbi:hypothetical protein VTK73DRAFT_10217 [Phialemonium thermophilum]|uniref:DUF7702 domain-containing protein n=1 Tax=Phialemonium thermophilum TaxID=223376 RepID=A0ABR3VXX9_9PEZI